MPLFPIPHSTFHIRHPLVLLALLLSLTACESTPQAQQPLPQLNEVRSRAALPDEPPPLGQPAPTQRAMAMIQQVDLPLHTNLDESWARTDERVLSATARQVWNANGIRMGLMAVNEAERFFDGLPYILGVHRSQLVSAAYPSAIRTSPAVTDAVRLDLANVPGMNEDERELTLLGGRLRLLMGMQPNPAGGVTVELLPHHQVRRLSLLPRQPWEKEMDGRLFEELAVAFDLNPGDVLVIGLHWPWQQEPTNDQPDADPASAEEQDESEQPQPQVDVDDTDSALVGYPWEVGEEGPELAHHLGRTLFASQRGSGPIQRVLLIRVQPLN